MSRTRYIVTYDICDPKRLRQVARICEAFGSRIQYSVFECPLDDLRLEKLRDQLTEEIKQDEDQVLFIALGPETPQSVFRIDSIGLPYQQRSRVNIV